MQKRTIPNFKDLQKFFAEKFNIPIEFDVKVISKNTKNEAFYIKSNNLINYLPLFYHAVQSIYIESVAGRWLKNDKGCYFFNLKIQVETSYFILAECFWLSDAKEWDVLWHCND